MLGFINAPVDRGATFRHNSKWIEENLGNPKTRFVMIVDERPVIDVSGTHPVVCYMSAKQVLQSGNLDEAVLLEATAERDAVFAVQVGSHHHDRFNCGPTRLIDLRSLAMQAVLPAGETGRLAQARSMLSWHENHRFCARCGEKTRFCDAGYRRHCNACGGNHFPRVDPVVIMLVEHDGQYLLGRGHNFSGKNYSALAGFVEPGETLEAAVRRETLEETGVEVGDVTYLMSQPWPFPSSLMIGARCHALAKDLVIDETELADARWFSPKELRQMAQNRHPKGFCLPPAMSIAYQMLAGEIGNMEPG